MKSPASISDVVGKNQEIKGTSLMSLANWMDPSLPTNMPTTLAAVVVECANGCSHSRACFCTCIYTHIRCTQGPGVRCRYCFSTLYIVLLFQEQSIFFF